MQAFLGAKPNLPHKPVEYMRIGLEPILLEDEPQPDIVEQAMMAKLIMHDLKDIVKAGVIEALAEVFGEQ